ncbi:MAG: MFS transporter [Saprospiraceae bacterium]
MKKPKLSFWDIWNMSFGFLGIQFGFALQGGFMSRIFQSLGAAKDDIPLLWIAAPLTGLLVQPIIGYLSDRTWHPRFGRRRPFFLIGAVLASIALFIVPNSWALWVAAGMLWVLDASINISMEPFRALVADKLPEEQRSYGFVVQTLVIGIGTWVASNLPWFITNVLGVSNTAAAGEGALGANVTYAFYVGGLVFIGSILYTVFTTKEYPPEDMTAFLKEKEESKGFMNGLSEIFGSIAGMPKTMVQLGVVQFFSWFAFFAMWSMATPAITEHVFKAASPDKSNYDLSLPAQQASYDAANLAYNNAADLVGTYMGTYGLVSMLVALILVLITSKVDINRKLIHSVSLALGGLGFIFMYYVPEPNMLHLCFAGIGVAWASILSMPYAMLAGSINPKKMGIYMGIFNMFIVIPQIIAALGGVNLSYTLLGEATINTMIFAGISLFLGAIATFFVEEKEYVA